MGVLSREVSRKALGCSGEQDAGVLRGSETVRSPHKPPAPQAQGNASGPGSPAVGAVVDEGGKGRRSVHVGALGVLQDCAHQALRSDPGGVRGRTVLPTCRASALRVSTGHPQSDGGWPRGKRRRGLGLGQATSLRIAFPGCETEVTPRRAAPGSSREPWASSRGEVSTEPGRG